MTTETAKELVKRSDKLFDLQAPWLPFWQETALQFYPQRADFTGEIPWGSEYGTHLFDDAPVVQRRDLANTVAAMLRPRGQVWFKPGDPDENVMKQQGVAGWFEQAGIVQSKWMYKSRSNFVRSTKQADHDYVTFGNAVLSNEVNKTNSGLIYNSHHLRDCAWAEDSDGEVDTLHRKIKMTARQLRQRFGEKSLHRDIKEACEKEPEKEFNIRHLMIPNADYEYIDGKAAKKFRKLPFVSVYLDVEHNEILSEAGSYDFRYIVARWQPTSSPYAFSPATADTLPGARQLQTMARTGNEALEKSIDPPSKAAEEAIRGDINLMAGGITWYDKNYDERGGPALEVFDKLGKNAVLALQAIDAARLRLANGTFVSKLTLQLDGRDKTAFETQKIIEEYIRGAMPVVEPWEANYSTPLLDQTFSILLRVGAFGRVEDMPDALSGRDFEWNFINPLQETKEKVKVQIFSTASALEKASGDPTVANEWDKNKAFRDAIIGAGAPQDWLRDEQDAQALHNMQGQIATLQQTIKQMSDAGKAAGTIADGAAKLGEAVTGTSNAIPS
jgi:hypothetical protein